ncbi:hypothetical protein FEDK69T_16930 [Flavobacterium enshiense DK69]|uniref:PKD-like domain-containing protein n=1 Tax=Flavobacterium enshiense TaxID=1341165 RepID=UPI0003C578D7|nr:PKD-like domain-containing protein [Flavobacterium enshiense]ESU22914.1 hypothetical protein FEDK69T_16930 [Flavobacterium enshiense DK69]
MKKNYTLWILLLFLSCFTYGQNCIIQKTVSDDIICEGQSATIVLTAAEANVTYELRLSDGISVISSQTPGTSGDLIFSVTPSISTNYIIRDITNGCSYTDLGIVTVNPVPNAFASNSSQTICSGESIATITLSGNVAGTTFNWTRNSLANVSGIPLSGNGDITGTLINTNTTARIITFTIIPTSSDGCVGPSITATVTVYPTPNINVTNSNQTKCSGNITTMTSSSGVTGTTFSWTRDNTTEVTGTIVDSGSGNSISGSLINNTTISQTVTFTITPTSANGCVGTPVTATIVVNPRPVATPSLTSQSICDGDSISAIVMSSNLPNTTYTWTRDNLVNVTGIQNSGVIDNITTFNISGSLINGTTANQNVRFTITPISEDGCSGTNFTSLVTVYPTPVATSSVPSQTKCSGVALASFGLTPTIYSWTRDNTINVSGPNSGSNSSNPLTGLVLTNSVTTSQTVNFSVTPLNAFGCSGSPITVTATINPKPNVTANLTSQTICSGDSIADIFFSSNVSGTTFSWTQSGTNIDFSGITTSPGSSISGVLTNTSTVARTATFSVTPNYSGCNGTSITVTVLVNPKPNAASVTNTNQVVCSGINILPVTVTQTVSGTSFLWTRDNTTNVTGIIDNGSLNSGQSISGTLINQTAIDQTVTFTITPTTANGCSGDPIIASILVEPRSLGGILSLTPSPASPLNNSLTVCHKSETGTLYLTGQRGDVKRWEYSINAGVTWIPITIPTDPPPASYNYPNVTVSTLYRAVVKYGTCPEVFSKAAIINVIPDIKPSPVTATPSTICNGQSSVLTSVSGYASNGALTTGGTFNSSNPPGWLVNNSCGNCLNAGTSSTNPGPWQLSATNGGTYFAGLPTTPASNGITYTSDNKFAIANGASTTYLSTPTFSTLGLTSASLTFADAYKLVAGATISIQISVNGSAYTTLWSDSGPSTRTPYTNLHLNGRSIDLTDYLGQTNLRIRFGYIGNTGSSWAVDNIAIPTAPQTLSYTWVTAAGDFIGNDATLPVTPPKTTTYHVVSNLNGCISTEFTAVTVTVIDRPTAIISQDQYVCYNTPATLTVHFTGSGPYRFTLRALNTVTNAVTNTVYNTPNASGNYTFNTGNLTATTVFTISALNDTKCTSISDDFDDSSATVTVLNGTAGLWTGLISTDWFDCRNWSGGLPSATVDAVIPTGASRMPVIDPLSQYAAPPYNPNSIASARDVIINANASVTMNTNSNLEVKRDWKNSGSFIPGTGTVTFNGATANQVHLINSGIKLNEAFYNLTLNCTSGAKGINVSDGFELTVKNNLVLTSGDLRLTGEAQLIQEGTTANPSGGTGVLLRDQQGTKSSYHYNYWSSPVSPNNLTYTISGVLRDGTNAAANPFNPGLISFGDGVNYSDGPLTSPIKISNRWLYKYTMLSTSYWSWQHIGSTGSVKVGEGFTMKGVTGSGPNTNSQNYTFIGKPNNGAIDLIIKPNQLYLVGNPYPSAMDAFEFIKDNIQDNGRAAVNVFNGALYYWDHFGGQSHYLAEYIGGYATYTLMGGTLAISNDPLINQNGAMGTKIPQRYIPVGQGFFLRTDIGAAGGVSGQINGGIISFKNSQRKFKLESPANSLFFKTADNIITEESDNRQKIRLGFESASGLHRQLLLGADFNTSNLFDLGYDAMMLDVNRDDIFWYISNEKFVIQAVKNFNINQIIPIGIKISTVGTSKIKIDGLENIPPSKEIYLFDGVTGLYHDLRNGDFTAQLPIGEYADRFSLRFAIETLSPDDMDAINGIMVFADSNHILNIKNNFTDTRVESVQLFNILGQSIEKWNVADEEQRNIKIPVEHIRSGTYIVRLKASNGLLSKKVIIR